MSKFTYEEIEAAKWFNGGYALMTCALFEEAI